MLSSKSATLFSLFVKCQDMSNVDGYERKHQTILLNQKWTEYQCARKQWNLNTWTFSDLFVRRIKTSQGALGAIYY